jgi:protein-tyrosine phosphatase
LPEPRDRRLPFEGAVNFRDMGGYPAAAGRRTRWERLYRADSLGDLTPADLTRLDALGLKTLVDFRLPQERLLKPNRLPPRTSINSIEVPFVPEGTLEMLSLVRAGAIDAAEVERRVTAQYRLFGIRHVAEYRRMFEAADDADGYPLLLHCTSGKDRTGFGVALLLLAAGVARETVLEDYALTNQFRRPVPQFFGPQTSPEVMHTLLSAHPKYLEAALEEVGAVHGSLDAYFERELGVMETARARLAELLTEPAEA